MLSEIVIVLLVYLGIAYLLRKRGIKPLKRPPPETVQRVMSMPQRARQRHLPALQPPNQELVDALVSFGHPKAEAQRLARQAPRNVPVDEAIRQLYANSAT
jgi:Holliday junction resolvasome RuvABC DNA-binding subunit